MDGASVRRSIVAARAAGLGVGRRGFPAEVRRLVAAYVARRVAAGATLPSVARELGVTRASLARWTERGGSARVSPPQAIFRRVEIADTRVAAPSLVVHGPRGVRVDGLDVAQVAELLRRLG